MNMRQIERQIEKDLTKFVEFMVGSAVVTAESVVMFFGLYIYIG